MVPALVAVLTPLAGQILTGPDPDLRAAHRPVSRSRPDREVCVISCGASRRTGAITGIRDYLQCMQPERAAGRLMRMKNELRIGAGLVLAVALAGCGATAPHAAAGHGPWRGAARAAGEPAPLRRGRHRVRARRARRVVPGRSAGQPGAVAVQPGQRAGHGLPRSARGHGAGHGRGAASARGERAGAGGRAAGAVRGAARARRPGRDGERERSGLDRPVADHPAQLPERRGHRLRRRGGEGATAAQPRPGHARDRPGHRDRDPRADPATAGARLAAGHRLGADRRALPEGGLGHPVPGRRDRSRVVSPPAPDGRSARNS